MAEKDWPGERGAPPGHKEGVMRVSRILLLLRGKADTNQKEGSLSFVEPIIKVSLEKHMCHACMFYELMG